MEPLSNNTTRLQNPLSKNGSFAGLHQTTEASPPRKDINFQTQKQMFRRRDSLSFKKKVQRQREVQAAAQVKPFCCSKMVVKYPWLVILASLLLSALSLTLIMAFGLFEYGNIEGLSFFVPSEPSIKSWYGSLKAEKDTLDSLFINPTTPHNVPFNQWTTYISYRGGNTNLLQSSQLTKIIKFEEVLISQPSFLQFCPLTNSTPGTCDLSQMKLIKDIFTGVDTSNQAAIDATIQGAVAANPDLLRLLDSSYSSQKIANSMRGFLTFAGPIEGFTSFTDRPLEQRALFVDLIMQLDTIAQEMSSPEVKITLVNQWYLNYQIVQLSAKDQVWVFGSFCLVLAYLMIHTKSPFISIFGMFETVIGFPIAFVINKLVFQVHFFATMHFNLVFMILGVAADDFFIFSDTWRQTAKMKIVDGSVDKQLAITYRRAIKSMLVTSMTSAVAFTICGFTSDIMPIKSLGYLGAVLLLVNYGLVCTVFPALIILRERLHNSPKYIKFCSGKCCIKQRHFSSKISSSRLELASPTHKQRIADPLDEAEADPHQEKKLKDQEFRNQGKMEKCFYFYFSKFVRKISIFLLIIFFTWIGFAAYFSFQIDSFGKVEIWLPEDDRTYIAIQNLENEFPQGRGDQVLTLTFQWGIQKLDRSQISMWDPDALGTVEYFPTFDISHPNSQSLIFNWCTELAAKNYLIPTLSNEESIFCFMSAFKTFVEAQGKSFPVPQADFATELRIFTLHSASVEYRKSGVYGFDQAGALKHMQIEVTTAVSSTSLDLFVAQNYYSQICNEFNSDASAQSTTQNIGECSISGGSLSAWRTSQKKLVQNSLEGVAIVLGVSFVILVFSTCNLLIAFYAFVSIGGIIVSNLASLHLIGWDLGVTEAMTLVVFIGFAIDYVVHLANHYVGALSPHRKKRMNEAYGEVGVSILGGAITTILSGILLVFAEFILFIKFAVLIILTIVYSMLFALFFFGSLAHLMGPEKNQCAIRVCKHQKKFKIKTLKIHVARESSVASFANPENQN